MVAPRGEMGRRGDLGSDRKPHAREMRRVAVNFDTGLAACGEKERKIAAGHAHENATAGIESTIDAESVEINRVGGTKRRSVVFEGTAANEMANTLRVSFKDRRVVNGVGAGRRNGQVKMWSANDPQALREWSGNESRRVGAVIGANVKSGIENVPSAVDRAVRGDDGRDQGRRVAA